MLRNLSHPVFAAALVAVVFLPAFTAQADQTIEVGHRGCLFPDAIRAANTNQPVGNCRAGDPGHDHIYIHGVAQVLGPPLMITEDLGVVGDRYNSTLDGQGRFSFFHVGPGVSLHLQDFFMSNGYGTRASGQARVESGGWIGFSTASVINCKGVKEVVAADDATVHFGHAASVCGKREPFNPHAPVLPLPGPNETPSRDSRKSAQRDREGSSRPVAPAPAYTCEDLPEHIIVRPAAGTRSGIQCQALDESGVGRQDVIDQGVVAAVDIWAYVDPGVEVCLRGRGRLLFLDAAFAPRAVSEIASYQQSDMTCARFNRAGSLVMVNSGAAKGLHPMAVCRVRTTDIVNFRDAPAGSTVYGTFASGAVVSADARADGWYRVTYKGIVGWISASYVETMGNCP